MLVWSEGFDHYNGGGGRFGHVVHARVVPTKEKTNVTWFTEMERPPLWKRLLNAFFPQKRTVYVTFEYQTNTGEWTVLEAKADAPFDSTYVALDLGVWLNGQKFMTIAREPTILEHKE